MLSTVLLRRSASVAPAATPGFSRACFTMPLRAKILAAKPEFCSQMSSKPTPNQIERMEDVLFDSLYGLRTIELNRPKKLNSLDTSMIQKITPRLREWEKSDLANVVVMKGAGDKAFCAGGDVAVLAENNVDKEGQKRSAHYFAQEYALDHLIATLQTPFVAFMDGITMGGGVGLSVHAPLRIATERTVFAMPETTIGFFPDVGGSFFLPRLDGAIGTYLALTSDRLTGVNVFYTGIATHYMHSTSLPSLESRLAELRFNDYDTMQQRLRHISDAIEEYTTGLPHDEPMLLAGELRNAIDRCFSHNTVPEIIESLNKEREGPMGEWANSTLKTLKTRSPWAVHVSLKQLRIAQKWTIRQTFEREHQLAARFMGDPDFNEGVRARLIDKPARKPEWRHGSLRLRPEALKAVEKFVMPSQDVEPIKFLNDRDFAEYPYAEFGLPRESDVRKLVANNRLSRDGIIKHFVSQPTARIGVKEVVEEIVQRKTRRGQDGYADWIS